MDDYYSASDDYPEPAQTLLSQLEARLEKASQALHVTETADRWRDARRLERAIKLLKSLTDSEYCADCCQSCAECGCHPCECL